MHNFTPIPALIGGVMIGLAASLMLLFAGRIAGISGIVGGLITPRRHDILWRVAFVLGLLGAGLVAMLVSPESFANTTGRSTAFIIAAGLLVGFGTRLGNGCTSGHGVCGISRLSVRSLAATVTFIGAGVGTVALVRVLGGA